MKLIATAWLSLVLIGCSEGAAATRPSEQTIAAASLDEVARMSGQLLDDVARELRGVTDAESARDVKTRLVLIADRSAALRERRDEVAGSEVEDKLAFGRTMMETMGQVTALNEEFTRLEGIPGVSEELNGVMTRIMELYDQGD